MSDNPKILEPKGVVAIVTGPDGRVWAHASAFDPLKKEDQEFSATQEVAIELIRKTCNATIASAIDLEGCKSITRALINKKGFRLTLKYIGYNEEGSDR